MSKMVKEKFGRTRRATLYRAIRKLEKTGLVGSELRDGGGVSGIRREYHLTPAGDEVADHLLAI